MGKYNKNEDAFFAFLGQIQNDEVENSPHMTITDVLVKYYWEDNQEQVITKAYISSEGRPHPRITILDKEWLNSSDFYIEFQTGYNDWSFDEASGTLTIECNAPSKMGSSYKVELIEAN